MLNNKLKRIAILAFDPPIPCTGGGTRSYHIINKLNKISNTFLFILGTKQKLPDRIENETKEVFFATSNIKSTYNKLYLLRLLFLPFTIPFNQLILQAQYYILLPNNHSNKFLLNFINRCLKSTLYTYVRTIYKLFDFAPARTYERHKSLKSIAPNLNKTLNKDIDILWLEFSPLNYYIRDLKKQHPNIKIIVNAHNVEYLYHQRLANSTQNKYTKKWHQIQAKQMKKVETKYLKYIDILITCSAYDKNIFSKFMPPENISVIPNGVDTYYFNPQEKSHTHANTILFTGSMGYTPNIEAVEYFIKNVWTFVQNTNPKLKFVIAGRNAGKLSNKYTDISNIEFIDSPEDMRPIFNTATIVVVPLLSGSGTRLKILEAMAMQKAIISTSIGAEGIDISDKKNILIADNPETFIKYIDELITNSTLQNILIQNGYSLAKKKYDWQTITKDLTSIIA